MQLFCSLLTLVLLTYSSPLQAQTCKEEKQCLSIIEEYPESIDAYLRLSLIYSLKKAEAEFSNNIEEISKYNELLFKYALKASELGSGNAQSVLAAMYYRGDGVKKSFPEAAKWHRKAAEQGFFKQQARLGAMYYRGQGIPKDIVEAYAWLNNGVSYGKTGAKNLLQKIEKEMTIQERQEAQRRSIEYFTKYVEPFQ